MFGPCLAEEMVVVVCAHLYKIASCLVQWKLVFAKFVRRGSIEADL